MMLALVRLTTSQALVGVYGASSIEQLRDMVDETSTSSHCDYACVDGVGFAAAAGLDGATAFRPSADLEDSFADLEELDWVPLDPNRLSEGSQLDFLLGTQAGRDAISKAFKAGSAISVA